jgi:SAM-dependent methyltransferase
MALVLFIAVIAVLFCFSFVLLVGPPYLPTLTKQVTAALDLVDLKEGQTLLELGCGDGKVLIAAAERGWNTVGYELNPILALIAWLRTRRYRGKVVVRWGNFWRATWPAADGIFVFILQKHMIQLDKKLIQNNVKKPLKLVSFAFAIPGKKPDKEKEGVFFYHYK